LINIYSSSFVEIDSKKQLLNKQTNKRTYTTKYKNSNEEHRNSDIKELYTNGSASYVSCAKSTFLGRKFNTHSHGEPN